MKTWTSSANACLLSELLGVKFLLKSSDAPPPGLIPRIFSHFCFVMVEKRIWWISISIFVLLTGVEEAVKIGGGGGQIVVPGHIYMEKNYNLME